LRQVAYLTPLYFDEESYLGGGERYPLNLAKGVALEGTYEVTLVSYGESGKERQETIGDGVSLRVLPAASRQPGAERLSWEIVEVIGEADLVHVHQVFTRSGEVGVLASKLLERPLCVTDHGGTSSALGRSLGMLDLADRVTCYSRFGAGLVSDSRTPVELVPGGVDDQFFCPSEHDGAQRQGVLFVGRLLPHKGVDRLIAAMPDDVPLTVCGQPYNPAYYEYLKLLAKDKRVTFLVDRNDRQLRDLYRRSIAVVLPSVYVDCYGAVYAWPELMGYSLLEGMACETPAICSRVGGMPEYVRHGETGYVFDELQELTEAIAALSRSPELVERLGNAARETVTELYGLRAAGAAMRKIYDHLLDGGSK
jgi:glycosyltransferase involved in cell wall biosynthesis